MDAVSSIRYSSYTKSVEVVWLLINTVILARLLDPQDFGLIAMVSVFTGVSSLLITLGTADAIIRTDEKYINDTFLSTIFWTNLFISLVVATGFLIFRDNISILYGEPIISDIITVSSINIALSSMLVVHNGMFERQLDFRSIFIYKIYSITIASMLGITLAYNGFGVWSLVYQQLAGTFSSVFVVFYLSNIKLRLLFSLIEIKRILSFSVYVSLSKFNNYLTKKADIYLIGITYSSALLGIYSKAYQLAVQFIKIVNGVSVRIYYPLLSRLQKQPEQAQRLFSRVTSIVVYVYATIATVFLYYSDFIVGIILGEKWNAVSELLPIFSFISLFMGVGSISSHLIKANGSGKLLFKFSIFNAVVLLISFIIGLKYGIFGVALAYLVGVVVSFLCLSYIAGKMVGLTLTSQAKIWTQSAIPVVIAGYICRLITDMYDNVTSEMIGIILVLVFSYAYSYFSRREESRLFNKVVFGW